MNAFFSWLKTVYSEPNGNGSSTRIIVGFVVAFIIGLGTAFGVGTYQKKFSMEQFDNFLITGGNFILTVGGPLYGVNKAADWLKNKDNNGVK